MNDAIRWQAIREANAVPGSSDPDLWLAAYKAACIVLVAKVLGVPLTDWQERWVREVMRPDYRCPGVELLTWGGRRVRTVHA